MFLELSKVDISSEKEILTFCNKYGLPCSSAINFDKNFYDQILQTQKSDLYRHDFMYVKSFKKSVQITRQIYETIEIAKGNIKYSNFDEQLSAFLSLILLAMVFIFNKNHYINIREKRQPMLMTTTAMMLQEIYISIYFDNMKSQETSEDKQDITQTFINFICFIHATIKDDIFANLINFDTVKIYIKYFCYLHTQLIRQDIRIFANEYGEISFLIKENKDLDVDDDFYRNTQEIAKLFIRDFINEILQQNPLRLEMKDLSNNNFSKEDMLYHLTISQSHLYQAIILELFNLLTDNGKLRKCANPTCNALFNILINAKFIAAMNVEY